jgi:hypothetical protein
MNKGIKQDMVTADATRVYGGGKFVKTISAAASFHLAFILPLSSSSSLTMSSKGREKVMGIRIRKQDRESEEPAFFPGT